MTRQVVRRKRLLCKLLAGVLVPALLGFAILEGIVLAGARTDLRATPDVMVILGAQAHAWGPSVLLEDRLKTALDYLKQHPALPVVVSGGQGDNEPMTEAQCMQDYLVAAGVPEGQIRQEDMSHNTSENLVNTGALLTAQGMDLAQTHLVVVSNGFHLARVRLLAARHGLEISTLAAPASHAPSRRMSFLREAPALVKSFLFDR